MAFEKADDPISGEHSDKKARARATGKRLKLKGWQRKMLGKRLRELREKAGISVPLLADAISVSESAVVKWELAFCLPTSDRFTRLLRELNVTDAEFWVGSAVTDAAKAHVAKRNKIRPVVKEQAPKPPAAPASAPDSMKVVVKFADTEIELTQEEASDPNTFKQLVVAEKWLRRVGAQ